VSKIKDTKVIVGALVIIVVVAAGAFFGGMKYQQSKSPSGRFANSQDMRNGGVGQRDQGFRPVVGEILNADDKSITVKLDDGSSKIVILPGNVTVSKTDTATNADLKTGVRVGVFGTNNSDGSVTAQSVQINPTFRVGQGGADGNHQNNPSASPR